MSLPSGVSPWNSIFGPGRRSKYNISIYSVRRHNIWLSTYTLTHISRYLLCREQYIHYLTRPVFMITHVHRRYGRECVQTPPFINRRWYLGFEYGKRLSTCASFSWERTRVKMYCEKKKPVVTVEWLNKVLIGNAGSYHLCESYFAHTNLLQIIGFLQLWHLSAGSCALSSQISGTGRWQYNLALATNFLISQFPSALEGCVGATILLCIMSIHHVTCNNWRTQSHLPYIWFPKKSAKIFKSSRLTKCFFLRTNGGPTG